MADREPLESVRLDVWLDVSCLFRTRSEAQRACKAGRVDVNGQAARPHRAIRPGDEIVITRTFGRQTVVVRGLADRSLPKAQARELYEDRTPKPSPDEIALRRAERIYRAAQAAAGRPDKRQRREARRLKWQ